MVATDILPHIQEGKTSALEASRAVVALETPSQPWHTMSLDLPQLQDYNFILLVVDLFNKQGHLVSCINDMVGFALSV